MHSVLVCDDERDIVSALQIYLESDGYKVFTAYNGKDAIDIFDKNEIHLILMDIMMPIMDGITAMVKLRESSNVPIILLTAKSEDTDKILGLNVGADDYITKPFNPVEMLARVRSQIRRYTKLGGNKAQNNDDVLTIGGVSINDASKIVTVDGDDISLTPTEYEILKLLMQNKGRVMSQKEIYENIRNEIAFGAENTIAVHIRHLREKIEINPSEPRYLKVVWAHGYKFEGWFYEKIYW